MAFTFLAYNLVEWHQSKHDIILNSFVNLTKTNVNWLMDLFTGLSPGAGWARQISFLPGPSRPSHCWCCQRTWRGADLRRPQQAWQWGHESCKHAVQGEVRDPGRWWYLSLENKFSEGNLLCVFRGCGCGSLLQTARDWLPCCCSTSWRTSLSKVLCEFDRKSSGSSVLWAISHVSSQSS